MDSTSSKRLLAAILAAAPLLAAGAPTPDRKDYDALVQRARAGDRTLDLAKLRDAAVRAGVEPDPDAKKALWDAANARDWKKILRAADAVLAQSYVDLDAHFFARHAAKQLGDKAKEDLHHWLEIGLLQELRKTGDGQSEATPMVVLSVDDEYFILHMVGATLRRQTLGRCGTAPCDHMEVVDEDGKESTWYFDVHIPMERLARKLGE